MGIFEKMAAEGHEQLILSYDENSNLKALVAIHDSTLGSALGGCRMWPYETEEEAIDDVLRLSFGMTAKSAITRCNHGGGKTLLWGDPETDKTEAYLRAFGRFIEGLKGRVITGTDMGTSFDDFVTVGQETDWLVGLPEYAGGSGNTSVTTAFGVLQGIRAGVRQVFGSDNLADKTVAVQGVGKVGIRLVEHLIDAGCKVIVTDIDENVVQETKQRFPVEAVTPDAIYDVDCDVFAPCAMGGVLNEDSIERLKCRVIAGAANNQLSHPDIGRKLDEKGILFAPDYIVNAGGLIQVADELEGFNWDRAMKKTGDLYDLLLGCFEVAEKENIPPFEAADRIVADRIQKLGRISRIYLPEKS